jgi:5-methylcytosine-specific restriction endonuclease McrA
MMVTIDHIIPIIEGGSHTRENVQTAHFGCNSLKDNHRDEAGKLTAKRQLRKTGQDAI